LKSAKSIADFRNEKFQNRRGISWQKFIRVQQI
jgi:hypothetical protein